MHAYLDLFREGGTEHHGLTSTFWRHGVLLHNTSDLGFETHIKHSVCLIQHQISTQNISSHFRTKMYWRLKTTYNDSAISLDLFCAALTCSSPGQSCLAPSCLPDDQVWPLAGDSLFPNHGSAGLYLRLRILHTGALWSDKQTAEDENKICRETRFQLNQLLQNCN